MKNHSIDSDPTSDADPQGNRAYRPGPHWFALLATVFTWPLLFVGGLVTTYRVGMAVPDWPTTFGINMFLYDMTQASWAVFGEHSHRLYGAAVGLFTLLLAGEFLLFERRGRVKWLGLVALAAVIIQGVLGGFRVRLNSTMLAAFHGCFAQAFFGFMVALCVLTGRSWFRKSRNVEGSARIQRMAVAALGLIYVQVLVGAWLRHYPSVIPLGWHAGLAVLVLGHVSMTCLKVEGWKHEVPELVPASRALALALVFQVSLGVAAWLLLRPYDGMARMVTLPQALIRTGHQANAGLLLATATVLALRSMGQLFEVPAPARSSGQAMARDLEAVA